MTDEVAEGWAEVVARAAGGGFLVAEDGRPTAPDDPQVHEVILLIDAVRELMTHPDGGDESYVPIRPRPGGRWVSTHTLEDHEIEILRHVVAHALDAPTRLRVLELLAARTKGLERVETSAKVIEHVLAEYAGRPFTTGPSPSSPLGTMNWAQRPATSEGPTCLRPAMRGGLRRV